MINLMKSPLSWLLIVLVVSAYFYVNQVSDCSKQYCAYPGQPALARDVGCICVIKAGK
jgi:hypothetical protein